MARLAASRPVVAPKALPAPQIQASPAAPTVPTAASATSAAVGGFIPAKGWGHDQYLGLVPLDTVQSPLGTGYDLVDATRSSLPHPRFQTWGNQTWYWNPMPYWGQPPAVGDYQWPYSSSSFFTSYTMDNLGWSADGRTGAGSTTNVWGDGQNYVSPYNISDGYVTHVPTALAEFHFGDANGQTAAVGAHYAAQVTTCTRTSSAGWESMARIPP